MSGRLRLRLRPLNAPRELARALGMDPAAAVRAAGWTRRRKRYELRVAPEHAQQLGLPVGLYRARSLGGCLIPAAAACALAAERNATWQLTDPDADAASAAAAAAAEGAQSGGRSTAVVAVLAHVNHGKTTLLDALLGTRSADFEPGSITQSVRPSILDVPLTVCGGASSDAPGGASVYGGASVSLALLDTPGHEAFGGMRAAASGCADVALVLASLDEGVASSRFSPVGPPGPKRAPPPPPCALAGVQPQTREAMRHCARLGVPTVLALTKLDLARDGTAAALDEARGCERVQAAAAPPPRRADARPAARRRRASAIYTAAAGEGF